MLEERYCAAVENLWLAPSQASHPTTTAGFKPTIFDFKEF